MNLLKFPKMEQPVPAVHLPSVSLNDGTNPTPCESVLGRTKHFAACGEGRAKIQFGSFASFEPAEKARKIIMDYSQELKHLPFPRAADKWLAQRSLYIRESTAQCYRDYLKRLKQYFAMPLTEIHIGHFQDYQAKMRKGYHPASVNHDLNILSQILKDADLWGPIREHYRPLPLPEVDAPKVMSEAEEDRFFAFAAQHEDGELAYWVASLTNNSTASGKELRMLQLGAIDLDSDPPYFSVPKNMKTPQRRRTIPLNERGSKIMGRLMERAHKLGSTRTEHYLFPFRVKRNLFDPARPASESWIKSRWKRLVDDAMSAGVLSFQIKPHNLRHQAITKLIDYGVPIETVRQIAGHGVDSIITRHYAHARLETLARAVNAIDPDKKRPQPLRSKDVENAG